jgi:HSP20 family molecular chaperone IbpA
MLLDKLFNGPLGVFNIDEFEKPTFTSLATPFNQYLTELLDNGKIKLVVNVVGHNPKDVEVEANNGELKIKATKEEGSNSFVRNVNLTFTIGREYDETSAEAVIENGLLTLTLDKKEEMKSKKIKIKF